MLQQVRVQVVREKPQALRYPRHASLNREQRLLHVGILKCRIFLPQVADIDGDRCHLLARVVVQVSSNTRAFHFLREDQLTGEIPDLRIAAAKRSLCAFHLTPPRPLSEKSSDEEHLKCDKREGASDLPWMEVPWCRCFARHVCPPKVSHHLLQATHELHSTREMQRTFPFGYFRDTQ
jgi:hypothetical protein